MLVATVHEMITETIKQIFEPEYRRLGKWIDKICRENAQAYGDLTLVGFVHSGLVYKPTECHESNTAIKRRGLHTDCLSTMNSYLADLKIVSDDKAAIRMNLFKILDPCETMQDVLDALPSCLHNTVSGLEGLTRERDPAWTIADDARAMRQFEKVVPKIEMYSAGRLLY